MRRHWPARRGAQQAGPHQGKPIGGARQTGRGCCLFRPHPKRLGRDVSECNPGFSSAHPGLIQFCLADGSVRALRITGDSSWSPDSRKFGSGLWVPDQPLPPESSAWWVVQELAGMRDGGVRDTTAIMP
jgi:hypothetical protein